MKEKSSEPARGLLVRLWDEAWEDGLWATPWKQALDGLSAEQAAWRPGEGRKSIWEIANHICFWREHELRGLVGEKVTKDEIERRNFEMPVETSESAWQATRGRLAATHRQIRAAIADERNDLARLQYPLAHDSYHVGQIMTLRAFQGLPPVA